MRGRTAADESTRTSGGVDGGAGPVICGNGSTRASARRIVRGGAIVVQPLEDRRLLDLPPQRQLPGQLQQHRAGDPRGREPERGACEHPADRVEQPQRRDEGDPAAHERARHAGDRLEERRTDERPGEGRERRVRRPRAAGEDVRREPRAEQRAGHEAGERQRGRHQPAAEPRERGQRDDRERDPVDARHPEQVGRARADPCAVGRYTLPRPGA